MNVRSSAKFLLTCLILVPWSVCLGFVPKVSKDKSPPTNVESSDHNRPSDIKPVEEVTLPRLLFFMTKLKHPSPISMMDPTQRQRFEVYQRFGVDPYILIFGKKRNGLENPSSVGMWKFPQVWTGFFPAFKRQDGLMGDRLTPEHPLNGSSSPTVTADGVTVSPYEPLNMDKRKKSDVSAAPEAHKNLWSRKRYDVPQIECPRNQDEAERFACPSTDNFNRYRCISDHSLCDGFIDCPKGEDEDMRSCMFYKTTKSHLDVLADALLRWARFRY